jgi:ABC-type antimicrobial peptide transport system permease subunit
MILSEGGVVLAVGLVTGVVLAILSARVIEGLLYGVKPYDPVTFVAVALLMAAIGLLACWIPAIRAARVDPLITMRAT